MSSDTPLVGEFAGHRPMPQSIQFAGNYSTEDVRTNLLDAVVRTGKNARRLFGEVRRRVGRRRHRLGPFFAFTREVLASPRTIGAVCPSSSDLARAMARELGDVDEGLVLELGAGTGNITQALLQQGIAPARLIAIERSPALAAHLRNRFPAVRVIDGDASQLDKLLGSDAGRVRAVVSGLPLRSLPHSVARGVVQQVRHLLPANGVFVQFTYDLRSASLGKDPVLRKARTRLVWKNMPPARVDTFVRQADVTAVVGH